jgi:hypothetical protein
VTPAGRCNQQDGVASGPLRRTSGAPRQDHQTCGRRDEKDHCDCRHDCSLLC